MQVQRTPLGPWQEPLSNVADGARRRVPAGLVGGRRQHRIGIEAQGHCIRGVVRSQLHQGIVSANALCMVALRQAARLRGPTYPVLGDRLTRGTMRGPPLSCVRDMATSLTIHHSTPVLTQNSFCSRSDILTHRVPPKLCTFSSMR
jgi:hypothetical protein